jgi:3-ketosteroid 9alpha-monooxygenase subunit B
MMQPAFHPLRVRRVIEETADARSLVFDIPDELAEKFHYRPGQFLTLRIPQDGRALPRCYSLASSPLSGEPPRVTIKRVADGRASNWICDQIRPGDTIDVRPPAGAFTPASLDGDLLLFAGGSGITPVFSILRSALLAGSGRIGLVYANRDAASVIFRGELDALLLAYPGRLSVTHWFDAARGVPSVKDLAEIARPWRAANCFVCGPAPFMSAAVDALRAIDIPEARIKLERFVSLPEDSGRAEVSSAAASGGKARLDVEFGGEHHEIACASDEPLLDAMLRAGIDVPYSCRAGACATCVCTLDAGEVDMRHNEVLGERELAQRKILACQAIPRGGHVKESFDS